SSTIRVEDAGYMELQIGANEHQTLNVDFAGIDCLTLGLRDSEGTNLVNACSAHGATTMITILDDAIATVSSARSALGAYQNRLESTQNSLDVSSENLTDAMSRIMDTDMAEAMTEYTQLSVLTQAATSMLTQANNRPQEIMNLLQS
ncbi:MAG: flagellin, partial [Lachnospiraceae bacterium]|nr:flagellin [Lachnospiraceae bacterium]